MNLTLNAVYFCATNQQQWVKGFSIAEVKKKLKITSKSKIEYVITAAVLNEPTEDELKNLFACVTVNPMSGSPEYYKGGRLQEDTDMILAKHVGWLVVEKNF